MFTLRKAKAILFATLITVVMPYTAQAASYRVVQGDSLYTIGQMFNTTSSAIMRDNSLSGTTIYPGQMLNVPGQAYAVKVGDSLYTIARRFGVTVDALRKANNKWDNMIYPGQQLVIPGAAVSQAPQSTGNSAGAVVSYSAADLDLLARLITSEAQGEPYSAQVAVGAVVVNRIKNSSFPNTISSVIYQKSDGYYQFTPVENGWINRTATADAKRAAYEALHGADPSNGALYYFDTSATNKWLWSKPQTARIGNLVFVI